MAAGIPTQVAFAVSAANTALEFFYDTSLSGDDDITIAITPSAAITTNAPFSVREESLTGDLLISGTLVAGAQVAAIIELKRSGSVTFVVANPGTSLTKLAHLSNYDNEHTNLLRISVNPMGVGVTSAIQVYAIPAR